MPFRYYISRLLYFEDGRRYYISGFIRAFTSHVLMLKVAIYYWLRAYRITITAYISRDFTPHEQRVESIDFDYFIEISLTAAMTHYYISHFAISHSSHWFLSKWRPSVLFLYTGAHWRFHYRRLTAYIEGMLLSAHYYLLAGRAEDSLRGRRFHFYIIRPAWYTVPAWPPEFLLVII